MKYPAYKLVMGPHRPYSGLWMPPPGNRLFLVRSGMLYVSEYEFNVPLWIEGDIIYSSWKNSRLASPAYYFKYKGVWKPVNPGSCTEEFRKVRDDIDCGFEVFVYENGKLNFRSEGKSHRMRWKRISETELQIHLNFS